MANLIDRIAQAVAYRLAAEMATDGPEYYAEYDQAFADARARGLDDDAAYAYAARVADAWKAAQREKEAPGDGQHDPG